jgi:hypothetical protein
MIRVHLRLFAVELFLFLAASSWAAPIIYCEKPAWDFGERFDGGALVHEYQIENRGDAPLVFGTLKNCCGMTVDFPVKELLPGSNAVCKVTFDISRRYGAQNKAVYIASNDRKTPYLILKMQGTLRQTMEIEPRYVRFSPSDGQAPQIVRLTSPDAPFSITKVSCTMNGVLVTQKKVSDSEWALNVQIATNFLGGKVNGQIEVITDHPQHPKVEISLYGDVALPITATPSDVVVKAGSQPVSRSVAVRSQGSFTILSADLKNCEGMIDQTKLGNTGWSFGLELTPASIQSGACLVLTTDHPLMPSLSIPVRLVE